MDPGALLTRSRLEGVGFGRGGRGKKLSRGFVATAPALERWVMMTWQVGLEEEVRGAELAWAGVMACLWSWGSGSDST